MSYTDSMQDIERRFRAAFDASVPEARDLKTLATWIFNIENVLQAMFKNLEANDPTLNIALKEFAEKEPVKFDDWLKAFLEKTYTETLAKFPEFDQAKLSAMAEEYSHG